MSLLIRQEIPHFAPSYFHKTQTVRNYLIVCHAKNSFHDGWMLCLYIFNRNCASSRGMFCIDTRKGVKNRLVLYMKAHEKSMCPTDEIKHLDCKCTNDLSQTAAFVIALDLRTMKLPDEFEGMAIFPNRFQSRSNNSSWCFYQPAIIVADED